jgi:uncharacterized protein (DUF433 family)
MNQLSEYITVDPDIRFGKPCVKGTRITVGDILGWLSEGIPEKEIMDDYPELTAIHIRAALAFAARRDAITQVFIHETYTSILNHPLKKKIYGARFQGADCVKSPGDRVYSSERSKQAWNS